MSHRLIARMSVAQIQKALDLKVAEKRAAPLIKERDRLQAKVEKLNSRIAEIGGKKTGRRKKRGKLSPAGRKAIALAQRRRWRKFKVKKSNGRAKKKAAASTGTSK